MTKNQREGFNKICSDCTMVKTISETELSQVLQAIYFEHLKQAIKDIDKDKLIKKDDDIKAVALEILDIVPVGELLAERLDEIALSVREALAQHILSI